MRERAAVTGRAPGVQPLSGGVRALDWRIGLALAAASLALLLATEPRVGLTWDEPAYIMASESYAQWLERLWNAPGYALSAQGVRAYWDINHEHPPLDKVWSGVVWSLARPLVGDLTAHRLGNMLVAAGLVGLLFWTVARGFGAWAGLAAAASLLAMPRFFFHAHLAALDVPAAAAVFGVTALFWQTRRRAGFGWDLLLGVVWGAALATKINALFVLPTLMLWALTEPASNLRGGVARGRLALRLVVAGAVGLPLFVALWPWLYHETLERLVAYVRFITVDHWEIGQWYFGICHNSTAASW
jgi:4-amino-4-deoxy-L-arabinose transferase-like glycosyltransferase